eukprot:2117509-Amphidinium_carterae.1
MTSQKEGVWVLWDKKCPGPQLEAKLFEFCQNESAKTPFEKVPVSPCNGLDKFTIRFIYG